jgi:hypothetical protein
MLDTFGMQQGGTQYRRLVAAFQRIFGAGTGVALAHSELIDAIAVRVIHRLKELIPERWEQADSHAILAQLGTAKLQAPMASHATDSAEQPGV